ncbi:MAG: undecaprenyl-diphosphate phosphatase [Planctomycetes bacterium]|nr:undecaprenyl-diphosphate phosphatase [Planctomycetota bacterium]
MELLRTLILAVVQGLTEFLPVSSDGHLVVVSALFEAATGQKLDELLALEIMLHAGTLAAVLIVFRKQIVRLLSADRRVIGLLIVGTVPAAVLGIGLKKLDKLYGWHILESPLIGGLGLIATGLILLMIRRSENRTAVEASSPSGGEAGIAYPDLTYTQAFLIGCFQAVAVLPGVSRSGSTIASSVALVGMKRTDAANFSFLLSIPAVGGAVLLQLLEFARGETTTQLPWRDMALGAVVAMVVGLAALSWLLKLLRGGKLHYFAYYCIPLGIAVTAWQLFRTA